MRIRWLAPAAAVLALAGAGAASAADWSEPLPVAPTPRPTRVVAVGIAGSEAIAAWDDYRVVGSGRATDTTDYSVWAAAGAVGGAPGPAQRLDRDVPTDPQPVIATSASGYTALAWTRDKQARVALRPPGGAFGAPVAIPSSDVVGQVAVGIDDAGAATVLWNEFAGRRHGPGASGVGGVGRRARAGADDRGGHKRGQRLPGRRRSRRRPRDVGHVHVDGPGGAATRRRRLRRAHDLRRPHRGRLGRGHRDRSRRPRDDRARAPRLRAAAVRRRRARAGDAGHRLGRTAVAGRERQRPPAHARGEQRRGARRAVGHAARLRPRPPRGGAHRARRPRKALRRGGRGGRAAAPPAVLQHHRHGERRGAHGRRRDARAVVRRRRGSDHPPALGRRGARAGRAVAGRRVQHRAAPPSPREPARRPPHCSSSAAACGSPTARPGQRRAPGHRGSAR